MKRAKLTVIKDWLMKAEKVRKTGLNAISKWLMDSGKLLLMFLALAMGLLIPYYSVNSYAQLMQPKQKPKHDTTYVQIVNFDRFALDSLKNRGLVSTDTQSVFHRVTPGMVSITSGRTLFQSIILGDSAIKQSGDTINYAAIDNMWRAQNDQNELQIMVIIAAYLSFLIVLFGMFWTNSNNKLPPELYRQQNIEPKQLTDLFKRFKQDIKKLGTRRKIIRFSNKVRVQFYLLTNFGDLSADPEAHALLMQCLLLLEAFQQSKTKSVVGVGTMPDINNEFETIEWLQSQAILAGNIDKSQIEANKKLIEKIYEMNWELIVQSKESKPTEPEVMKIEIVKGQP